MSESPEILSPRYEIYLEGKLIESQIIGLSVTSRVNKIPKARIELNYRLIDAKTKDKSYEITPAESLGEQEKEEPIDFLPGKKISIKLGYESDNELKEVFVGYIVKQNIQALNDGSVVLSVEARHAANRMTLAKRTRFYHHSANSKGSAKQDIDPIKDEDVFEQILKNDAYDLKMDLNDFTDPGIEHENMTQYDCSDWDFMVMRAEALGHVIHVEEDKIKVLKAKIETDFENELALGRNIFEYEAEYDERLRADAIHFKGWDVKNPETTPNSAENLVEEEDQELDKVQSERYFNHSGEITDVEAKAFLENEQIRQELGMVRAMAKTRGTHEIQLTKTIGVSGFDSVWDRATFVSGLKHVIRYGSWYLYVECGMSQKSHAEEYKIAALTNGSRLLPAANGLIYGKVEAYKNSGSGVEMIEVIVPSSSNTDEVKSIYARLATFSGGEKGGAVFRPYPGDEVIIGFVDNDPRFPVILGSLYMEKYPFELDEDKQHEVGFSIDDWKLSIHEKDKKMTIASKNGQSLVLDDEEKSIVMAFDDQNSIKISSDGIEMNAKNITLSGTQGVEIDGMKIAASADSEMSFSANASLKVESKGTMTVKGQVTQIN